MFRKKIANIFAALLMMGVVVSAGCASSAETDVADADKASSLDPANPIQIEVWTYYNGAQQQAFEDLVKTFNSGRGKELGVVVSSSSQGGVNDLAQAVEASAQEMVGSSPMPDAFLSYSDTAFVVDKLGRVADLSSYLSDEERGQYVESFMQEGDISNTGGLKVFPVAKSTETLQINQTDWISFADATGSMLSELESIEGITAVAERYYHWIDGKTPEVVGDGSPFFGRDALANYLLTGSRQLGHDILRVENGVGKVELERATMKKLWDNYYIPMVHGWFSDAGKFRSDAVKTGNLLCYVGSSSAVVYFPQMVTIDDKTSYPIELLAMPAPTFKGATPCAPQQGAGFAVAKSDEKRETACVEFLKWFTSKEQNSTFAINAGYVPVKKDALTQENLEAAATSLEKAPENYLASLPATLESIQSGAYVLAPFEGSSDIRVVLDTSLAQKAAADRSAVVGAIELGSTPDEAVAPYLEDAVFEAWLNDLASQLKAEII